MGEDIFAKELTRCDRWDCISTFRSARRSAFTCDFYSASSFGGEDGRLHRGFAARSDPLADQAKGHTVDTIYFGGGTPSYLGADRLCRILETVFAHYRVDKNAEITTEANPDSAREVSALRQLREAGFNRISLGMQSASDDELRLIGRVHTHKETVEAVHAARTAGFDNVSLDLIYGLPEQTMAHWRENLQAAIALEPEHLSCYGLKIEEGTPLDRKKDALRIPDDDEQAEEYLQRSSCSKRRATRSMKFRTSRVLGASRATTSNTGRCRSIWASVLARIRTSAGGASPTRAT